jgi:hypothetical protein
LKKGKILKLRIGVNPNSSSLGSDLSVLLMGAVTVMLLVNLLDAGIRLWLARKRGSDRADR